MIGFKLTADIRDQAPRFLLSLADDEHEFSLLYAEYRPQYIRDRRKRCFCTASECRDDNEFLLAIAQKLDHFPLERRGRVFQALVEVDREEPLEVAPHNVRSQRFVGEHPLE